MSPRERRRWNIALAVAGPLGLAFGWWQRRRHLRRLRARILYGLDGRPTIVSNLGERLPG